MRVRLYDTGVAVCLRVQRLILQKAFSSQQLVHITVINLFELHHLRDLTADGSEQSYSSEQQISWFQLLGLFSKNRKLLMTDYMDGVADGSCFV